MVDVARCYECLYPDSPANRAQLAAMKTITSAWFENNEYAYNGVGTGNGKTRILCAAGYAAALEGRKCIYLTPTTNQQLELIEELREQFDDKAALRYGAARYICIRKAYKMCVPCPTGQKTMHESVKVALLSMTAAPQSTKENPHEILVNALMATASVTGFHVSDALERANIKLTETASNSLQQKLNALSLVRSVTSNTFSPDAAQTVDRALSHHIACTATRLDMHRALLITACEDTGKLDVEAAIAKVPRKIQWERFTSPATLARALGKLTGGVIQTEKIDHAIFDKCVEDAAGEFVATQRETLCSLLQRRLHLSESTASVLAARCCKCTRECFDCPKHQSVKHAKSAHHVVLNYDLLFTLMRDGRCPCCGWREIDENGCDGTCRDDVVLADEAHELPERIWNFCNDELGMLRHPSHDPILRVAFNTLFCDCTFPDIPVVSGEADKLVSDSDFRAFVAELRTVHEHMRKVLEEVSIDAIKKMAIKIDSGETLKQDRVYQFLIQLPATKDERGIVHRLSYRAKQALRAVEKLHNKMAEVIRKNPRAFVWGLDQRNRDTKGNGLWPPTVDLFPDVKHVRQRLQGLWNKFELGVFCSGTLFDYPWGKREADLSFLWTHTGLQRVSDTSMVETPSVQRFDRMRIVFGRHDKGADAVKKRKRQGTDRAACDEEAHLIAQTIGGGRGLVMSTSKERTREQYETCVRTSGDISHLFYEDDPHRTVFSTSTGAYHGCRGLMTGTNDKRLNCIAIINSPWNSKTCMYHDCVKTYHIELGIDMGLHYRYLWVRAMRILLRQAIGRLMRGPDAPGGTVLLLDSRLRKEAPMLRAVYPGASICNVEELAD